ncbi:hypothetical protein SPRG_16389 [Saprolegnia parasitica CBS 223.65]|uniref:Uncharacterized protein n=1 Tax=Saprolegnia parasitica (strain CBS 223.65) TaxID=695850 RepID=A0A067BUF4_SAPPC|nr:hypothetical protein SPRG_16389 [Saprolegnia parasitica CBS 223.65]KDO18217.1 hypothetical protein SPRG_16389 [Saprolegnia parasitica CBS 223.65]|eukprot:XP_012211078.1 hypothetical protein SPRG_16389 [Saprolegnia parasitica CBS 223.65]
MCEIDPMVCDVSKKFFADTARDDVQRPAPHAHARRRGGVPSQRRLRQVRCHYRRLVGSGRPRRGPLPLGVLRKHEERAQPERHCVHAGRVPLAPHRLDRRCAQARRRVLPDGPVRLHDDPDVPVRPDWFCALLARRVAERAQQAQAHRRREDGREPPLLQLQDPRGRVRAAVVRREEDRAGPQDHRLTPATF